MVKEQGLFWRSEDASLLGPATNYARYLEVLRLVPRGCVMRLRNLSVSAARNGGEASPQSQTNSSATTLSCDASTPLDA